MFPPAPLGGTLVTPVTLLLGVLSLAAGVVALLRFIFGLGAVGFGKIEAQVSLAEDQDGTVLKYIATAEIGGKLASLGNWLVQIAAQKTADDFFAAFNRRLSAARVKASMPSLPHANQYRG